MIIKKNYKYIERVRLVLESPSLYPSIVFIQERSKIEVIYDEFVGLPTILSNVDVLLNHRRRSGALNVRIQGIVGISCENHKIRHKKLSFNVHIGSNSMSDSVQWLTCCNVMENNVLFSQSQSDVTRNARPRIYVMFFLFTDVWITL